MKSAEIEAANRAEATALLIRAGYRVYRPEADIDGEDLVIRRPDGSLRVVQLKARPSVDWKRYGAKGILMLFPNPTSALSGREWYLVDHDCFFDWTKIRHGHSRKWKSEWSYPSITKVLAEYLAPFRNSRWQSTRVKQMLSSKRKSRTPTKSPAKNGAAGGN